MFVTARSASPIALVLVAAAIAGCGGDDPVSEAIAQQTVTVQVPAAPSASTAPATAAPTPAAPEDDAAAGGSGSAASGGAAVPAPGDEGSGAGGATGSGGDVTAPAASGHDEAAASAAARPQIRPTVHLLRSTALRERPGGRVIGRLTPRTEFGSPTVLPVVAVRGGWLGVVSKQLPNNRIGWISARTRYESHRNSWRIDVSLSRRRVAIRHDGRIVQRFPVAIGGEGTPTPTGRYAVTDKLLTRTTSSPTAAASSPSAAARRRRRRAGAAATGSRSTPPTCRRRSAPAPASAACARRPTRSAERSPPSRSGRS